VSASWVSTPYTRLRSLAGGGETRQTVVGCVDLSGLQELLIGVHRDVAVDDDSNASPASSVATLRRSSVLRSLGRLENRLVGGYLDATVVRVVEGCLCRLLEGGSVVEVSPAVLEDVVVEVFSRRHRQTLAR